jgi:pimeloyl-ACP methyl ester carboxylesterase
MPPTPQNRDVFELFQGRLTTHTRGSKMMRSPSQGRNARSSRTHVPRRRANLRAVAGVGLALALAYIPSKSFAQAPAITAAETTPTVGTLVERYFRTDADTDRNELLTSIEKTADGSIEAVADAVRRVMVWDPMPGGDVAIQAPTSGTITAKYRGFLDLNPALRHGLILCMPNDDEEADTDRTLNRAIAVLGPGFDDGCGLVALSRRIGGSFHQSASDSDDLRFIIRELRKRIHIDTDQVYLYGQGHGGEAAWITAMFHPDLFAGVITLSAYPPVPYPQQLYPILLGNLRNLPVLSLWPASEKGSPDPRGGSIAAHNRAIVELAERLSLPIRGIEAPFGPSPLGPLPPRRSQEGPIQSLRAAVRPPPGRTVSHWFRYLGQGDVGWLHATKLAGDVWDDDQLSIVTSPTIDRDRFISDVLKEKLLYLGGRIDGQTIHLETKGCAEIELRLFDGIADLHTPITVLINGRKRHEGLVRPSMATLLESARKEWEFQRLVVAKLSFSVRTDSSGP